MKQLTALTVSILLSFLMSLPAAALQLAKCRGGMTDPDFAMCPDCKNYKAEGVTPLPENVEDTLWTCNGKPLNVAECAHQCQCDGAKLECEKWEGCSAKTVTNFCKCRWNGDDKGGSCAPGSENKLWQDGGMCFCSGGYTVGSPPHPPKG